MNYSTILLDQHCEPQTSYADDRFDEVEAENLVTTSDAYRLLNYNADHCSYLDSYLDEEVVFEEF